MASTAAAVRRGSSAAPGRRRRPALSGWIAAGAAGLALALPTPYVIEGPGPAIDVLGEQDGHPVITVEGTEKDPGEGVLDMTTVLVSGPPGGTTSVAELASAVLSREQDVVPRELVYPTGQTAEQVDASNAAAMTSSQETAAAAALRALGRDYATTLVVRGFADGAAAADVLREGDEILTAGGRDVASIEDVRAAVDAAGPGTVTLRVRRDGDEQQVRVPVAPAPDGDGWQMGAFLEPQYDLPVDVRIGLEDVGGPSAGMMFALGVIERLTPGAMTGGAHIAGTGTVEEDGTVGAIGGIPQKVRGAADAGATVFLAPVANCPDLTGRVPQGMTVYAVDTLTTARAVVEAVGRGERPDGVPTCG